MRTTLTSADTPPAASTSVARSASSAASGRQAPQQDARTGAGDRDAQAPMLAAETPETLDARHERGAIRLVQAVAEQQMQVVQLAALEGEYQPDRPRERLGRIGERDRRGERPARTLGRDPVARHHRHEHELIRRRDLHGAGVAADRHDAAEDACAGVVGVPLDRRRAPQQLVGRPAMPADGVGGHQARAHRRGGRAQAAAERDAVVALHDQAVERVETLRHGPADEVVGALGKLPGPLPRDVHLERAGTTGHRDRVRQVEGEGERVEPGPEVGRRGGRDDAKRLRRRGPPPLRRASPARPSRPRSARRLRCRDP